MFSFKFKQGFALDIEKTIKTYVNTNYGKKIFLILFLDPDSYTKIEPFVQEFVQNRNVLIKIFDGGLSNENVFAFIMIHYKQIGSPDLLTEYSTTLCDWKRKTTPTRPYQFNMSNKENTIFMNKHLSNNHNFYFFARKIGETYPDEEIIKLQESSTSYFPSVIT